MRRIVQIPHEAELRPRLECNGSLYPLPAELGFALRFAHGIGIRSTLCPRNKDPLYSLLAELGLALHFAPGKCTRKMIAFGRGFCSFR